MTYEFTAIALTDMLPVISVLVSLIGLVGWKISKD